MNESDEWVREYVSLAPTLTLALALVVMFINPISERAGVREGDQLLAVNGAVLKPRGAAAALAAAQAGAGRQRYRCGFHFGIVSISDISTLSTLLTRFSHFSLLFLLFSLLSCRWGCCGTAGAEERVAGHSWAGDDVDLEDADLLVVV